MLNASLINTLVLFCGFCYHYGNVCSCTKIVFKINLDLKKHEFVVANINVMYLSLYEAAVTV